jgi:hypothetical protein
MILSDYGMSIVLIDVGVELGVRMITVDEVREGDRIGMNDFDHHVNEIEKSRLLP